MTYFAVTVKLPKNPEHDPRDKKTGTCPVSGLPCDDVTGEHHTFVMRGNWETPKQVREHCRDVYHITRVEKLHL